MRRNWHRARQLPASDLGVLNWQREFWLFMVEHALSGQPGPPDLSLLEGFNAPALVQYAVTTPELLRNFRKYNAERPYNRQVRPFGFMVMFQQEEECEHSTMMRVIAPFNRKPGRAAKKAFDRDTGEAVSPNHLKTYVQSLRTYYNHPEAKFLNGERADRGPTRRRHIIARSIVHIGKEANRLEMQLAAGTDPSAQAEFNVCAGDTERMEAIKAALKRFGPSRAARDSGLSRKHISAVANGVAIPTEAALSKIEQAISRLEVTDAMRSKDTAQVLDYLRVESMRIGLRQLAINLCVQPSVLSRIISGRRTISSALTRRASLYLAAASRNLADSW